jgi:putative tryptophan/tyrosine transport system substrate-binding protein
MQFGQLKRRELMTLLGAAVAWPLAARAQQPAMPVIGFLNPQSPEAVAEPMRGLRRGLKDAGYLEGENLTIEYRWADNHIERLPALAAELVRRRVAAIIVTGGAQSALAAKAAISAIPVVFNVADDPVGLGLIASLARPGGNLTGVTILVAELTAKRLELLRELVPGAVHLAVLSNPNNPAGDMTLRELDAAARAIALQLQVFKASTSREIDAAFATFARKRPDALFVTGDALFLSRRVHLALLAAFHHIPTTFALRDFVEAGGLMSYGASLSDAYRQVGLYAGRILKGAKPTDLPVVRASKFELVINAETARMLGLTVPPTLLATADEVIE